MDKPGYIVPPPGLIPSSPQESSETVRLTGRSPLLPVFVPAGPHGATPAPPRDAPAAAEQSPPPAPPQSASPQWNLTLHDGSVIHVDGTLLLGRDPGRVEHWESAGLLRINDPEKSVSKTHAALDCSGEDFVITDLHSTNGVVVIAPDGGEATLIPGVAAAVTAGSTVELGRYRIGVGHR